MDLHEKHSRKFREKEKDDEISRADREDDSTEDLVNLELIFWREGRAWKQQEWELGVLGVYKVPLRRSLPWMCREKDTTREAGAGVAGGGGEEGSMGGASRDSDGWSTLFACGEGELGGVADVGSE